MGQAKRRKKLDPTFGKVARINGINNKLDPNFVGFEGFLRVVIRELMKEGNEDTEPDIEQENIVIRDVNLLLESTQDFILHSILAGTPSWDMPVAAGAYHPLAMNVMAALVLEMLGE